MVDTISQEVSSEKNAGESQLSPAPQIDSSNHSAVIPASSLAPASSALLVSPQSIALKCTRVTKLVMDGFKSFGKRTELLFEPGFNSILGPNGSGKSNILDALCFVLGKSSSKQLRAEKSSNLIYNGGKTKNPAKEAEVTICFDNIPKDNHPKTFPVNEDEVKVSRIVRHDGASKYKINGRTTTRQEIIDLLGLARINPDGYNIILQGDIVRLVEMSPIERREIIEEIAGIGIYEEKKQMALNDLAKVEQKLGEAEIILKERERGLRDLKQDRDQALKYKELHDDVRSGKASIIRRKIDRKENEKKEISKTITLHSMNLERLRSQLQSLREEAAKAREQVSKLSKEIEERGEVEQVKRQKELEQVRIDIATQKTRMQAIMQNAKQLNDRAEKLIQTANDIEGTHKQILKEFDATKHAEEQTRSELASVETMILAFKKKHGLGEAAASMEQTIAELDKKADEQLRQVGQVREQQQNKLREKDKLEFQLQTIDGEINRMNALEKEHHTEIMQLKNKKEELKRSLLRLNELLNTDSKQAAELSHARQRVQQLRDDAAKLEARQSRVRDMIAENMAVKKVLENRSSIGEVHGTVAELGTTDPRYTVALEVAAAQKLQSVVVSDDKTAANAIKFLKKGQFGVATFLPMNKMRQPTTNTTGKELLKEKGVHGLAIDLIDYDPKFRGVFHHVFGSTLVVDSIDTARKIGIGTSRMVSLDGDLAETSGAMIGGFRHKRAGSFKEKGVADDLAKKQGEIAELEDKISRLEASREHAEQEITSLREKKAELEGEIIKGEHSLHINTTDLDINEKTKEELIKKQKEIDVELAALEDTIATKTSELLKLKNEKQKLRDDMTQLRNPRVLAELNAYEQKRQELAAQVVRLETEAKNMNGQAAQAQTELGRTNALARQLRSEELETKEEFEQLEKRVNEHETEAKAKDAALQEFYAQFKQLFEERSKHESLISSLEKQGFIQEELSRREEIQVNTYSLEDARVNAELSSALAEFSQYEGVMIDNKQTEEKLQEDVSRWEQTLASMGAVNMRALDIYDAAERELGLLKEKKEVLVKEQNAVRSFMQDIETKKTGIFMNTLGVLNNNFRSNFLTLSTKGDADLELENKEQPFAAGLLIKVRLTGDKFLDIRSLSGGEKTMTALAFLFAIQDHEPAPFYVLDEVDAALDKHNSDKLAKLIRKYTDRAQYIVISHNDAVLTEADTLYGVSMNEHGVSQVVSIRA